MLVVALDTGAERFFVVTLWSRAPHPRAGRDLVAWGAAAVVAAVGDSHGSLHALAAGLQTARDARAGHFHLVLVLLPDSIAIRVFCIRSGKATCHA